jgi:hypothetical protein
MNNIKERISVSLKESVLAFTIFLLRLFSGALLGLSIAISMETFMGIGIFTFMFIVILTSALVLRMTRLLGLLGAIIFLLVLVLIGVLLQLYILKAMNN